MVYILPKKEEKMKMLVYVCVHEDVYFCKRDTGRISQRMIKFVTFSRYVKTD